MFALTLNPTLVSKCRSSGFFKGLNEVNRYKYENQDSQQVYSDLKNYINNSPLNNFLISSECFLEGIDYNHLYHHLKNIDNLDIKIIVYLRPQISWLKSVYKYVVMDKDLRFSGHVGDLPQIEMLNYFNTLENITSVFGEKSLIVRNYIQEESGDYLIKDFINHALNIDITLYNDNVVNENASLNDFEISILNYLWMLEKNTGVRSFFIENFIYSRYFSWLSFLKCNKIKLSKKIKNNLESSNLLLFKKYPNLKKFNLTNVMDDK
ncbi:hypothetical protein EES38_17780 [Vibrio viridaestus]|uniref:Uncharacterized protein n=2 Tax=Vibrio viridaestus TaxID=2487322 RepID=A0A3N9TXQ8_9VIBR|nr:hypothetical protein EES38_17780 [Vibrio viridaestus]